MQFLRAILPAALLLTASMPATAGEEESTDSLPFFMGEDLRFQNCNIFSRFFYDLTGTFANIGYYWEEEDWLYAGLTAAGTLALMAPTDPSPDARLQFWVVDHQSEYLDPFFPRLTTERFTVFGAGLVATTATVGYLGGWPELLELSSLVLETLGFTQTLHIAQKLLIGREGPAQGDGLGIVYGPSRSWEFFPSGTPSGHTASVFALATLTMDYFDEVWLDVIAYASMAYVSFSVMYHNQHFISDVVWGAPMGYFIGKWVVRNRSSKYRYENGEPKRKEASTARFIGVIPWAYPEYGASGLSLMWSW